MSDTRGKTTEDSSTPKKRRRGKQKDLFTIFKVKNKKLFSSKQKHIEYLNDTKKKEKFEQCLEEITKLKDFDKINVLLNKPIERRQKNPVKWPEDEIKPKVFWNTSIYLVREIEKCILTRNWDDLTRCLLSLKNSPKQYHPILFKAALINFTMNPESKKHRILEDFLRECLGCHNSEEMENVLQNEFTIND